MICYFSLLLNFSDFFEFTEFKSTNNDFFQMQSLTILAVLPLVVLAQVSTKNAGENFPSFSFPVFDDFMGR